MNELTDFYNSYADLTFLEYQKVNRTAQLSFHTPPVLTRELEHTFSPYARSNPEETLEIIDLLWNSEYLEPRQFASTLLGALPISYYSQVLERIQKWSASIVDEDLLSIFHNKATLTIRRERSDLWIKTLALWIQSQDPMQEKMAVMGLLPFLNDPDFSNLPIIYEFLSPLLLTQNTHLNLPMMIIFENLIKKSETETVFFLKQLIRSSDLPSISRFIRRITPIFSPSAQQSLKTYQRENLANRK